VHSGELITPRYPASRRVQIDAVQVAQASLPRKMPEMNRLTIISPAIAS